MTLNARSKELINNMEDYLSSAFSELDKGIVTLRFMSIGRDSEISVSFSGNEEHDPKEVSCRDLDQIRLQMITELRETMFEKHGRGAWLSGFATFDCFTEEFDVTFNYDERFNTLNENWMYSDADYAVTPDRFALIVDFEQHPRDESQTPEWYFDLLIEQQEMKKLIKNANAEEIFIDQIDTIATLHEKFDYLSDIEEWEIIWEKLNETYIKFLLHDKNLIKIFVDDSKIPERSTYLFEEFEPKVINELFKELLLTTEIDDRANSLNLMRLARGEYAAYDLSEDDDMEIVDEEMEEIIKELVMSQTRQRFVDLDETDY